MYPPKIVGPLVQEFLQASSCLRSQSSLARAMGIQSRLWRIVTNNAKGLSTTADGVAVDDVNVHRSTCALCDC